MPYFNYHANARRLIADGKLTGYIFVEKYRNISPALILMFNDEKHPIIPIREHRFDEYLKILPPEKKL